MSAIVAVDSLDTKLPMNDADEVLSEAKELGAKDVVERSDPMASKRLFALVRSRTWPR